MQQRHITLFIPGLLGNDALAPDFFQGLEVSALELILSRAHSSRHQRRGLEASLFNLFGYTSVDCSLPVAALTHIIDQGSASEELCLRADPVHLQPDRDRIIMFGNQQLSISMDEAQQLADEFNRLFGEDGLKLETPTPNRWYLKGDSLDGIKTVPLSQVIGKDIHHHLPQGKTAMQWHSLLNEVQMLFYGSSVNERRRQRGLPEINSLWLWGEGVLPVLPPGQWQQVWTNEIISSALAQLSNTPQATLPASAEEWLEQSGQGGQHLVVIEAVADALQQNDIQRWRDMIESVNEDWLQSLIDALKSNTLKSIRLLSDHAEYEISAKRLKHWWKRRRPIALLAK